MSHSSASYSNRWSHGYDREDEHRPRYRKSWHPGWIVATVIGFLVWWPLGLMLLFFTLGGKDMFKCGGRLDRKMERMREKMERGNFFGGAPSSGNRAFDEYRVETLKRLEDEQREFKDFLERLRHAKDKEEFDQFMAQQRGRSSNAPAERPADQ